jgi:deoxyribose-phosphate aldolase
LSGIKKRAADFAARRVVKKEHQVAWLLRAITCIDLTTLSGDDTSSNVQKLCFKASNPIREDLLAALGLKKKGFALKYTNLEFNLN